MAEDYDRIIRLRVPRHQINNRVIADADLVIDQSGVVIKDRYDEAGREPTEEELAEAAEVYG